MSAIYSNRLTGEEIRIFELQPGLGKEPLEIRLITSDLSNEPDFEAISYVWGDQIFKSRISWEGEGITIPENLHDALLQMRLPQTSRSLWADAICINQHDLLERNQQVSLMQRVFSQASTVVVWLGRDRGEQAHLAVRALNSIYERCMDYAKAQGLKLSEGMSFKHLEKVRLAANGPLESAFDNETWSSISCFYARPWFERIWCVQEIVLAQQGNILIDTYQISWERVSVAAAILGLQINRLMQYSSCNQRMEKALHCGLAAQLYFYAGKSTLLENLEIFGTRKATDPRDIVYGLLSLQDYRLSGRTVEPDYRKNTAEVYIDVVMAAVNDAHALRILSNVRHEDSYQHRDDIPSWVPYWPRHRSVSFLDRQIWSAGGQQASEVSFPSRRQMTARGIIFEEIISISDVHPISLDEYGSLHPFPDLMVALWTESDPSNLPDGSRLCFKKLCRTLTGGHTIGGEVVHQLTANQRLVFYSDYLAFINHILKCTGQRRIAVTPPDLAGFNGNWERYARVVRYACRSRRIFRTQEGSIGLGPACAGIGDRVCVLNGGKVPYVIRPIKDDFYFLGECYMDNIMRGELYERCNIKHFESRMLSFK
ncbi:hypothetical protein QQS21_005772 [Conoideocrella luteorostrata]|uniref:Heterokaryon incompatibility domain-containing protein n=1 Tax=Conoideocrella luteorostrata TaxID=1105319 RepID=A0AAJ0CPT0_9HYPO|nr:hypothetical protein QQS21_005772 [Conoideocrella luteorostrata]